MAIASQSEFAKEHGILGYLHYIVFPLDLLFSGDEQFAAEREQRVCELTPILCWLMPLILLLSSFTYLSGIGLGLFILFEVLILLAVSIVYCWRLSLGFIIGLFFNYLFSFIIMGVLLYTAMFIWASCGMILIVVMVIAVIAFFSRGNTDYYDDDW